MFVLHREQPQPAAAAARPHGADPLEGYTEDEKVEIAQRHLIEKQIDGARASSRASSS
jgi:hypothetical protein